VDLPRPGRVELFVLDERRTALAFLWASHCAKCRLNRQDAKNAKVGKHAKGDRKLIVSLIDRYSAFLAYLPALASWRFYSYLALNSPIIHLDARQACDIILLPLL
jgi:hypothetical protein